MSQVDVGEGSRPRGVANENVFVSGKALPSIQGSDLSSRSFGPSPLASFYPQTTHVEPASLPRGRSDLLSMKEILMPIGSNMVLLVQQQSRERRIGPGSVDTDFRPSIPPPLPVFCTHYPVQPSIILHSFLLLFSLVPDRCHGGLPQRPPKRCFWALPAGDSSPSRPILTASGLEMFAQLTAVATNGTCEDWAVGPLRLLYAS
jgi:hypothetical protein